MKGCFFFDDNIDFFRKIEQQSKPVFLMHELPKSHYKLKEFRNPYFEDTENLIIKEPMAYGNPFKIVTRVKNQKQDFNLSKSYWLILDMQVEMAFLTSYNQTSNYNNQQIASPIKKKIKLKELQSNLKKKQMLSFLLEKSSDDD